jgi:hypothetical protein
MSTIRKELPSIWESWPESELEKLRINELIHLHMNLQRKEALVADFIDRYQYFDDDKKYLNIFLKNKKTEEI